MQISNFQTFIVNLGDLFAQGGPAYYFVTGLAYVLGITLGVMSLVKFNQHSTSPERVSISEPIGYLVAAILLIWLKVFITISHDSLFGFGSSPISYLPGNRVGIDVWNALIAIFKFFGLVAIIRGILHLKKISGGGQQQDGGISKAVLHILGGVILYYVDEFARIAKGTFT